MNNIVKAKYPILKMHCTACARNIEKTLSQVDGITDAVVNFANNTLIVSYDSSRLSALGIQKIIRKAGYDIIIDQLNIEEQKEKAERAHYLDLKRKVIGSWCLAVPLFFFSMLSDDSFFTNIIQMLVAIPMILYFGSTFYIGAYKQILVKKLTMDTLVTLSTSIAFLFSLFNTFFPQFWLSRGLEPHVYYEASVIIIAFVLTGKLMEERAKGNTSRAIKKLMKMQPQVATIVSPNGKEHEVLISDLKIDDSVVVHPGDQIPVDGVVVQGESYVDESMISGEPIPVSKRKGCKVLSGTINQHGSFVVQARQVGSETVLSRIIQMVQEAQGSKAPVQRIVDQVTQYFIPIVLIASILTIFFWLFFGGVDYLSYAILSAVSVLVIACPCALGLATPTALMVGIGKAASQHILVKDAVALEQMRKINAIVLDKTGTLTEGTPMVTECFWMAKEDKKLKSILLASEKKSEHPLANAIVQYFSNEDELEAITLETFESIVGKGVVVDYDQHKYWVGSHKFLKDFHANIPDLMTETLVTYESEGKSIIFFGCDEELLAIIAISDVIKATSVEAIKQLTRRGIEIYMLTGDGERTARSVAKKLGIEHFVADALPENKEEFIRELQMQRKKVAMVGDGINDSQALAMADVSVAMGKGTDIAMDVAMVTLMTSDLLLLPKAIDMSKSTVRLIRQNLFWAFIYNLIGIPIAAGVLYPYNGLLLNPMLASAAMAFSSVSVVLNSLTLARKKI